jgi:hypothetical protein
MTKFILGAFTASCLALGGTTVFAQTQKDPTQKDNVAVDKKVEKDDAKTDGVGSRAIGPTKDEKATDPNLPKQGEIKKLDKEGRGGQQN